MNPEQENWEVYREIWEITEYRDDSVYKTRYLRDDWVPMGRHGNKEAHLIYATITDPNRQKNPRRKGNK